MRAFLGALIMISHVLYLSSGFKAIHYPDHFPIEEYTKLKEDDDFDIEKNEKNMYVLFYGFENWKCTDVILAKTNSFPVQQIPLPMNFC
jgi:hypothetical protein